VSSRAQVSCLWRSSFLHTVGSSTTLVGDAPAAAIVELIRKAARQRRQHIDCRDVPVQNAATVPLSFEEFSGRIFSATLRHKRESPARNNSLLLTNRAYGECDDEIRFPDHTAFPRGCVTVLLKGRVFNLGRSRRNQFTSSVRNRPAAGECART
jgi:hypothetical protein